MDTNTPQCRQGDSYTYDLPTTFTCAAIELDQMFSHAQRESVNTKARYLIPST
jgi:hypothetical protein